MASFADGRTLAEGRNDSQIVLWDISTPAAPRAIGEPLDGHNATVLSVQFSPDGRTPKRPRSPREHDGS
jgi:WD40 repeat protein